MMPTCPAAKPRRRLTADELQVLDAAQRQLIRLQTERGISSLDSEMSLLRLRERIDREAAA